VRYFVVAVFFGHIVEYFLAAVIIKVDVHIGQ
jgi:hypothetical protein